MLAAVADEEDARVAEGPAAVRATAQPFARVAGLEDRPWIPVRALDDPRHDVLEPTEDGFPFALGLSRAVALVDVDGHAAPAALLAHPGQRYTGRTSAWDMVGLPWLNC
jgi:hypothetical protein